MVEQGVVRRRVDVEGIVQGVGFRPYVFALAADLGLDGWVENNGQGVRIEVQGPTPAIDRFVATLPRRAPPLSAVDGVTIAPIPTEPDSGFRIVASRRSGPAAALVSPDVAPCADCLREIADPAERRHRYAFTNCTNCGPRYSIVTGIPYDRPNTTMAAFALCPDCRREYDDQTDRRFHAQPICCPACGPRLSLGVEEAAARLRRGQVLAVKGLGGFHLATLAGDEGAVATLRARKHRADKPFALLVADVAAALALCEVSEAEAALLASPARPIVLLARRPGAPVATAVAPATSELGLMLPSTPLHRLLVDEVGEPLVCTSGNVSDEPIAHRDDDARSRLGPIADAFLTHDRPIRIRVDDSVYRVVGDQPYPIRRSRGYAPAPIAVPWPAGRPILALGADLKSTVAVHRGRHVFPSQHIGDLDELATHRAFTDTIEHLCRLLEVEPAIVACDLHPDYRSTGLADLLAGPDPEARQGAGPDPGAGPDRVEVQHHHAHVASCLADAGRDGPVIGVAFDGLGYGDDGTIWGGEFLVADLVGYERVGHLAPVPQPGGDAATRQPWRMAAAYLDRIGEADGDGLAVVDRAGRDQRWADVVALARSTTLTPLTSSAGRLFDAVSSLLGIRDEVTYEGQAAIELEQVADRGTVDGYEPAVDDGAGPLVVRAERLVGDAVADLRAGVPVPVIAARFHNGLAGAVVATCELIRERAGLSTVALSGGVFLNRILLLAVTDGLSERGFEVLRHRQVPCNDGGIALGQAVVAAARDRAGRL